MVAHPDVAAAYRRAFNAEETVVDQFHDLELARSALMVAAAFCESSLAGDGRYDPAAETLKVIRAALAKTKPR